MKKLFLVVLFFFQWALLVFVFLTDIKLLNSFLPIISLVFLALADLLLMVVYMIHESKKSSESRKFIKIPEFTLKEVKFYELSMLLDGHMNMRDVLAILVHYALFPPSSPDQTEQTILRSTSAHTISSLYRMYYHEIQTEEELEANIFKELLGEIKDPAINALKQKKYFRYNPMYIKVAGIIILVVALFPLVTALGTSGLLASLTISIAIFFLYIGIRMLLFSEIFYENFSNILPLQAKARGYEMYLKAVEWHTVKHDREKFKEFIPYFLLYNLKKAQFEDMIDFTLEYMQSNTKL